MMPGFRARRLRTPSGTRTGPGQRGRCARWRRSGNPRYTGRQVWNRQRTDFDLADPANTGLGHKQVQRWNQPEGWVISKRPAHPALVSEADFIAAQDATAPRGPAGPAVRRYLLAGLLACGRCGRRLKWAWSTAGPPTAAATDIPPPSLRNPDGPRIQFPPTNPHGYDLRRCSPALYREADNRRSESCTCVRGPSAPKYQCLLTSEFFLNAAGGAR